MKNMYIASLMIGMVAIAVPAVGGGTFSDTKGRDLYFAVDECQAEGFIEGYPDGTFRPDHEITRYEVALIVARVYSRVLDEIEVINPELINRYKLNPVPADAIDFKDMANNHWAAGGVECITCAGIMVGDYERFKGDEYITAREARGVFERLILKFGFLDEYYEYDYDIESSEIFPDEEFAADHQMTRHEFVYCVARVWSLLQDELVSYKRAEARSMDNTG